ncbi:MAG: hypothetical protein Q8L87_20420 [Anaerolineales bacterium]|nr:hypothetical protein [Anaerolineales bacterium]
MTLPNWKAEDYFVDFETFYFEGKRVQAPIIRKIGWIIENLNTVIYPDAIRAIVNGGELSGLLLGFSVVEYLAGYYFGRNSNSKDVKNFMSRYFPGQYKPFTEDIISQLRNGLVHNLSISNPWVPHKYIFTIEKRSDSHLQEVDGKIIFSIYHYLEDGRRAMVMYFYDMVMKSEENQDLIDNFEKRFNKKDGSASMIMKTD